MLEIKTKRPIVEQTDGSLTSNATGNSSTRKTLATQRRLNRQSDREESKSEREKRMSARRTNRKDRKSKRNAKKLQRIETKFGKKFVFPLTKLIKGRKKYPDGSTADVKAEDVVTMPNGDQFDKNEVADALNTSVETVNAQTISQNSVATTDPNTGTTTTGVTVPDDNVSENVDGSFTTIADSQDVLEETVDKKTEDKEKQKMSTTTKVIIISASAIALGILGYILYNAGKSKS